MFRKLLILVALVVVSGGLMAAVAAKGKVGGRAWRALDLQKPQLEKLRTLRMAERKEAIRKRADLQIRRLELRELIEAPTIDQKAIDAKVVEVADLQASALRARVAARLAMRSVLTSEQQEKLRDFRLQGRGARNRAARPRQEENGGDDGSPRTSDEAGSAR
jgi:Spy/CpxP family protein refolding chaperone